MKILTISTMFPNNVQPNFGIFVKHRLEALSKLCQIKVVSAIPYCPLVGRMKRYQYRVQVVGHLNIDGLEVHYPRFFSFPMILKPLDAVFIFLSLWRFCRKNRKEIDIIDAHLAYPDGFAAVLLGKVLKKPVSITLRGHDIFDLPRYPVRGRQAKWAMEQADIVLSVAQALKDGAVKMGISGEKIKLAANGVDTKLFYPIDRRQARGELHLPQDKRIILSAGHLVVRKGFHYIIRALDILKRAGQGDILLVIAGAAGIEGDYKPQLDKLITELGLGKKVIFAGGQPNHEMYRWYSAADIFCLASLQEGMANVLLEALACGCPVVATRAWGNAEVICKPELGLLAEPENADSLAEAIREVLIKDWDRTKITEFASRHSWGNVADTVFREFNNLL